MSTAPPTLRDIILRTLIASEHGIADEDTMLKDARAAGFSAVTVEALHQELDPMLHRGGLTRFRDGTGARGASPSYMATLSTLKAARARWPEVIYTPPVSAPKARRAAPIFG